MLRNSKTWPVNQALSGHVNSSLNCSHMTRTCFYLTAIKLLSLTYLFRCGTTLSPLIPGTRVTHLATSQPLATSTCPLCTTNCSMSLGAWMIILYKVSEVKRAFSINIERCDFDVSILRKQLQKEDSDHWWRELYFLDWCQISKMFGHSFSKYKYDFILSKNLDNEDGLI